MSRSENCRNDVTIHICSQSNIDKKVRVLEAGHNLFNGGERNVTFGWINKDEIQRARMQLVKNLTKTLWVLIVADTALRQWRCAKHS